MRAPRSSKRSVPAPVLSPLLFILVGRGRTSTFGHTESCSRQNGVPKRWVALYCVPAHA
jgi:hypothetical protein